MSTRHSAKPKAVSPTRPRGTHQRPAADPKKRTPPTRPRGTHQRPAVDPKKRTPPPRSRTVGTAPEASGPEPKPAPDRPGQKPEPRRPAAKKSKSAKPKTGGGRKSTGKAHAGETRTRWERAGPTKEPGPDKKCQARRDVRVRSKELVARVYGVALNTIDKHVARGMPGRTAAGYDLIAIGDWRRAEGVRLDTEQRDERARLADEARDAGDETAAELFGTDWGLRRDAAEAQIAELKLDKERDLYAIRDEVERIAAQAMTTLRLMLRAVAVQAAVSVPRPLRPQVKADVDEIVVKALQTCRAALGRAADPARPREIRSWLDVIEARLDALPESMGVGLKRLPDRRKVRANAQAWLDGLRTEMARVGEGEGKRREEGIRDQESRSRAPDPRSRV